MNDDPIPVAVVGAGNMGSNHIRVYDELPEAELVEVVESDPEQAAAVRENYDVRVVDSVADLRAAEAATVAVPNVLHREVAEACASRGIDILVEKPLAMNVEDARAIVDAADDHDVLLQVGHIERFNPAVETLGEILKREEITAIEAHRLGPFNEQLSGESVVFDLMIHDLDVLCSLVDQDVERLSAIGSTVQSRRLDHVIALLKFDDGVVANLTSSHVTHGKIRTLRVTTRDALIELDYQSQNVEVHRRGMERTTLLDTSVGYRTETVIETPYITREEPLRRELESFLACVRSNRQPLVDGTDGLNAVRLAERVIKHTRDGTEDSSR